MASPNHAVDIGQGGVYTIQNKASGTFLDLKDGSTNNETPIVGYEDLSSKSNYLNQNWYIQRIGNTKFYTITNVTSGSVVDLYRGSRENGTRIQGYVPHGGTNQQWYFLGGSHGEYSIISVATNASIDLQNGGKVNDTKVQEWSYVPNDNQLWTLKSRSVSIEFIQHRLATSGWASQPFGHYSPTRLYIVPPPQAVEETYAERDLANKFKLRPESFDHDSFANAFKGDMTYWAYDNIRAPVGLLFGTAWYNTDNAKNAWNWTISSDLKQLNFWDPQHGTWSKTLEAPASFGLY